LPSQVRLILNGINTLLEKYKQDKEPENVASPLDHDLITKIILQSRQLPAWQIDLYPKMNRLIEQYLSRNEGSCLFVAPNIAK